MFSWFHLFSFTRGSKVKATTSTDVEAAISDKKGRLDACTFCEVSKQKGFDIVYEVCTTRATRLLHFVCVGVDSGYRQDDSYVAFQDRNPAARQHLLVVPKRHIGRSPVSSQACLSGWIIFVNAIA